MAETKLHTTYCPRCDRAYLGTGTTDAAAKLMAESRASKHVTGQHPDMTNPFLED